jgi:hypothetical protein
LGAFLLAPERSSGSVSGSSKAAEDLSFTARQQHIATIASSIREAMQALSEALRERQFEADVDPSAPYPTEVKLGLASRQFRLLNQILANPTLWFHDRATFVLRAMVDAHIVVSWLIKRNDPHLYEQFVEFGRGRLKLYKLHFELAVDEDGTAGMDDFLNALEEQVNEEIYEEFQTINIGGSFAGGVSARSMAAETGLTRMYNLLYQRLSADAHGEWSSLLENDLAGSGDPLYHGHRFGLFDIGESFELGVITLAFTLGADTLDAIFDDLGIDVRRELEECREAVEAAFASPDDAAAEADTVHDELLARGGASHESVPPDVVTPAQPGGDDTAS